MFVLCYFGRALYWLVYSYSDFRKVIEYFYLWRRQFLTFDIFVILVIYTTAVASGEVVHLSCGDYVYLHCSSLWGIDGTSARLGAP